VSIAAVCILILDEKDNGAGGYLVNDEKRGRRASSRSSRTPVGVNLAALSVSISQRQRASRQKVLDENGIDDPMRQTSSSREYADLLWLYEELLADNNRDTACAQWSDKTTGLTNTAKKPAKNICSINYDKPQ
jgi:hypothetical protein